MKTRSPSDVDLTAYLRKRGSPLADHVPAIMRSANRYRIDPRLLVAISGGETSFGTNGRGPKVYNAWGIGPGRSYASWQDGIDQTAKLLRESYVGKGLTSLAKIQQKWAPVGAGNDPSNLNSNWLRTIGSFYSDLGGNPMNVTGDWRKAAAPQNFQPPPAPRATPIRQTGFGDQVAQAAMANLSAIASGQDPSKLLGNLVDASIEQTIAESLASKAPDFVAEKEQQKTPDGGKYNPTTTSEIAPSDAVQRAVQIAKAQLGKPYVWATSGPKSFDCSGLIEYAFEQAGIKTPGRVTTYSMRNLGRSVKGGPMQPGDWVITNKGKHVVMYIGGGEVIAAPHKGENVQIQSLADHRKGIVDVRRYP